MPERDTWEKRIKSVERQYHTMRFGTVRLRLDVARDPTIARQSAQQLFIGDAEDDLEVTYLVRMFAEFESGLRSFWRASRGQRRHTRPQTSQLLDAIASNRRIGDEVLNNAHVVRTYRNALIHDNDRNENFEEIRIGDARRDLLLYFGRLPYLW